MSLKIPALAAIALGASTVLASAQDFPEIFPAPHEPTRSSSALAAPPGTIPSDPPRGGLTFDLFSGPSEPAPRCEEIYDFVNGERTLVSVRCRD